MQNPEISWAARTVDYLTLHPTEAKIAAAAFAVVAGLVIGYCSKS